MLSDGSKQQRVLVNMALTITIRNAEQRAELSCVINRYMAKQLLLRSLSRHPRSPWRCPLHQAMRQDHQGGSLQMASFLSCYIPLHSCLLSKKASISLQREAPPQSAAL